MRKLVTYVKHKIVCLFKKAAEQPPVKDTLKNHQEKKKSPPEKEPTKEMAEDLARADDDGFVRHRKNGADHLNGKESEDGI